MWSSHDEAELTRDIIKLGNGEMSPDEFREKHPDKIKETTSDNAASGFSW